MIPITICYVSIGSGINNVYKLAGFNTQKGNTMRNRNTTSETKTYNHEYAVRRAVQFVNKDVLFDLTIDDFTIYDCRVVEGKNGDFISLPSRKGKDGKYWGIVYKRFSQDETSLILDMVSAVLAEQDLPF